MYKYQSTLLALRCPATSKRGNNNYVIILRHYFVIRSQSNAVKLCTNIRTKLQFASLAMMENILLRVIMVSYLINLEKKMYFHVNVTYNNSLGSKDQTVIIWSIDDYSAKLAKKVELGRPVCYLMWSPNDKMLLITGTFIEQIYK